LNRKEWEKVKEAADMLGLKDKASLAEIKKAYRSLSKKHHPDLQNDSKQKAEKVEMHDVTEAYQLLLHYCAKYRFPLVPGDNEKFEGDDWWFNRFGHDHHWGDGCVPKEDTEE
jgi:DnaJ-class molecular chaperone